MGDEIHAFFEFRLKMEMDKLRDIRRENVKLRKKVKRQRKRYPR